MMVILPLAVRPAAVSVNDPVFSVKVLKLSVISPDTPKAAPLAKVKA
jgi:hypothetical protein